MTDPGMADHTYIEPLTVERITAVIEKERPDALLPNLGGQTALNLASKLHEEGILKQYGVEVIGVDLEAIARGEDRIIFKETMDKIGVPVAKSEPVYTVEEAEKVAAQLGYPVVLRPAYTMGGTGGGIVYNVEELRQVVPRGLAASLINQVLVEECVLGWEELELEVVRDAKGQKITVCFIENVDPMGVHTRGQLLRGSHADRSAGRAGQASGLLLPHSGRHRRDGRHERAVCPQPGGQPHHRH